LDKQQKCYADIIGLTLVLRHQC